MIPKLYFLLVNVSMRKYIILVINRAMGIALERRRKKEDNFNSPPISFLYYTYTKNDLYI